MATPANPTLLPDPACLHLAQLEASENCITAVVATITSEALCPLCQQRSEKIHFRSVRLVGWDGQCDWNCTRGASSVRISNARAKSSQNVCQVNRLKLLKRQMYGRGSFQILRKRVLHRAS